MRLSIIIRCWNRLEYTIRTIISIDQKSGLNKNFYEIICVDQGSTDGTREWLTTASKDGYYPIRPIFMSEGTPTRPIFMSEGAVPTNVGDGRGMQAGIEIAKGDFIAQHDNDIEIKSSAYYRKLIDIYDSFARDFKICALGGVQRQGIEETSAPFRFAREKLLNQNKFSRIIEGKEFNFVSTAWCTASFIFRRKFAKEVAFGKGMCNSWCGEWFDRGYENFVCTDLKFYHIDSGKTGAHVQRQYDKFPNYDYVLRHYRSFVKKKEKSETEKN